jgi:hypothetical protein
MVGDMCFAMQAEILHEARSEPSWALLASAAVPLLPQLAATAAAAAKVLSRQAAGADVDDDQAAQSASTDILAAFIRDESHATMNRFYTDEPERYNDDTYLSDTISNAINLKRAISSYPDALQQLGVGLAEALLKPALHREVEPVKIPGEVDDPHGVAVAEPGGAGADHGPAAIRADGAHPL